MADDPVTRHFFNGFIRVHILYHAAKEPFYGAEITEEIELKSGLRTDSPMYKKVEPSDLAARMPRVGASSE